MLMGLHDRIQGSLNGGAKSTQVMRDDVRSIIYACLYQGDILIPMERGKKSVVKLFLYVFFNLFVIGQVHYYHKNDRTLSWKLDVKFTFKKLIAAPNFQGLLHYFTLCNPTLYPCMTFLLPAPVLPYCIFHFSKVGCEMLKAKEPGKPFQEEGKKMMLYFWAGKKSLQGFCIFFWK